MRRRIQLLCLNFILAFCPSTGFSEDFPKSEPVYSNILAGINHELVRQALSGKVSVDLIDERGATALIHASALGDVHKVAQLLKLGANVNHRKNNGSTAIIAAAQAGRSEVVEVLANADADLELKATLKRKGGASNQINALFQAVRFGYFDTTKMLLKKGASPNPSITDSPLLVAYEIKNLEIFELLLKYGADPNTKFTGTYNGSITQIPLVKYVMQQRNMSFLAKLQAAGADLLSKGGVETNQDFYEYAVKGDLVKVRSFVDNHSNFQLLVEPNANMRASSFALIQHLNGSSPSKELVEFLLLNGANPNARLPDHYRGGRRSYSPMLANLSALDQKRRDETNLVTRKEILYLLLEYGAELFDPNIIYQAYLVDLDIAESLVDEGAKPNPMLDTGLTISKTIEKRIKQTKEKLLSM